MTDGNRTQISQDYHRNNNLQSEQISELSDEGLRLIKIVVNVVLSGLFVISGLIFNVINIVVFLKNHLNNTVNISMLAIAVSDLCSLVTLEWGNINGSPFFENVDILYEPTEIQYLTGSWTHACFFQITICITVYVTAERFVCVALPLKVKQIFTPLRTKVVIILIYLMMFLAVSPEYLYFYFGENFYPARNQTRVGLVINISYNLDDLLFMFFAVIGTVSFIVLFMFTFLLVSALNQRLQWRKTSTTNDNMFQSMSARDLRTMKMVVLVAGVLIVCAAPGRCLAAVMFVKPDFDFHGKYANISNVSWSIAFFAETVNSTINILFFYKMSSRYKRTFHALFSRCISNYHKPLPGCTSFSHKSCL